MPNSTGRRSGSIFFPILMIALGVFFFWSRFQPDFNPWTVVSRWWPLLLIVVGLGKLWDYARLRNNPEATPVMNLGGGAIVFLVFLLLVGASIGRSGRSGPTRHETQSVDRHGTESVRANLEMNAGELKVSGGAARLLEADFDYSPDEGKPTVDYSVSGEQGQLSIRQRSPDIHMGNTDNTWNVRLANDVPLDLRIEMGAGQSDLKLAGLSLSSLDVQMGAGQLDLDLTGDWKKDVQVRIEGGAGSATIHLPRNVGVRVDASGGIGSINVSGLESRGGDYVNDALGKSPVTMRVTVHGGVGEINLVQGS